MCNTSELIVFGTMSRFGGAILCPVQIEISNAVIIKSFYNCQIRSGIFIYLNHHQTCNQIIDVIMTNSYKCTICEEGFPTKDSRENHFRRNCQPHVNLMDSEGTIVRVVRTEGKFRCHSCSRSYQYSNKLVLHWKTCNGKTKNESTTLFYGLF
jgi:hypothetical protein